MCEKMEKELKLISMLGFKDALRPIITNKNSMAGLLNPLNQTDYKLVGNVLYKEEVKLSDQDVLNSIGSGESKPIHNNVILYSLFSYVYETDDLYNEETFHISLKEFRKYLGVATGVKGYEIVAKLEELRDVVGVIYGVGVFQVLEVLKVKDDVVTIRCPYLKHLLVAIKEEVGFDERKYWYTTLAEPNMLADKNQMASLVAIELVVLTATLKSTNALKCRKTIKASTIVNRIPELTAYLDDKNTQRGNKNRRLKQVFNRAYDLYEEHTSCFQRYEGLEITRVIPTMGSMSQVVEIKCTYLGGRK